MILLDASVVVETLRAAPHERVVAWLDAQAVESLCISALSMADIMRAIEKLPIWQRKTDRGRDVSEQVSALFEDRIVPFDLEAARAYVTVTQHVRRIGYSISRQNGQNAAIAAAHNFIVASRDTVPFTNAGLYTMEPWLF